MQVYSTPTGSLITAPMAKINYFLESYSSLPCRCNRVSKLPHILEVYAQLRQPVRRVDSDLQHCQTPSISPFERPSRVPSALTRMVQAAIATWFRVAIHVPPDVPRVEIPVFLTAAAVPRKPVCSHSLSNLQMLMAPK